MEIGNLKLVPLTTADDARLAELVNAKVREPTAPCLSNVSKRGPPLATPNILVSVGLVFGIALSCRAWLFRRVWCRLARNLRSRQSHRFRDAAMKNHRRGQRALQKSHRGP